MLHFGGIYTSALLLALPLAAQSPARTAIDPSSAPHPVEPAHTVPVELLRFPLSGKAREMLQKAMEFSDRGDHKGAITQLLRTIAKHPDTGAYVYSLLGVEYLKTDQFSAAAGALEQAVTLLPHDASNHANLGLALVSEGDYARAKPELRRALELDPQYKMARQLLGALSPAGNAGP